METKMFKITAILLMLAGNFFPCGCSESAQNPNYEKISPCHPDAIYVYMPWMDAIISEWLEGGVHGRIYQCRYKMSHTVIGFTKRSAYQFQKQITDQGNENLRFAGIFISSDFLPNFTPIKVLD